MHPTDRKYKKLALFALVVAGIISLFNIIHNPYNILGLGVIAIITFANRMKPRHRLTLFAIFTIFILLVINLIELGHGNQYSYSNEDLAGKCFTNFIYATLLLSLPLFFIYAYFMELIQAMEHEKKYYQTIKYSPHLACKTHFAKTLEQNNHGFKDVSCRIGKTCLEKNHLVHANEIVGLIGCEIKIPNTSNNYYITLWDNELDKINDADFDVIEVHENPAIEDFNGIITKTVSFFYNELERYKPLNEMIFRIVGNPEISESTKRLLKERFLRIEYINEQTT
jgi:hypothetical protein